MEFSQHTKTMGNSLIRELVAQTRGVKGMISLAGGFPASASFPKESLSKIYARVVLEEGEDVLQYGQSEGDSFLKEQLKIIEDASFVTDDNLLITSGSTNAIYYFTRCLIEEGDVIIVEGPTFLGSIVAFEATGALVKHVEMDNEGLRADLLEDTIKICRQAGKRVKFLYTISEFQNPTGITMSLKRREEILSIAVKYDLPILEDNPYGQLRFKGEKIKDLYRLAYEKYQRDDIVTCVKSFSKILGPGLRVAYAVGSKEIIGKMCSWMQKVNVTADCVSQRAVARFTEAGLLTKQINFLKSFYLPKLECLLASLQKYMPADVQWTVPEGGMFSWLTVKGNTDELFKKALEHKVAFVPSAKFYPSGKEVYDSMRLNFSYPSLSDIETGIQRLNNMLH